MATITVDPNTSYQTFLGWECVGQTGLGDALTSGQNYHNNVLDAAVAMGVNRIRTEIKSGFIENTTDYYALYLADGRDYGTNAANIYMHGTYFYAPVNDNADPNSANLSGFVFSDIDWQINNVIIPMKSKLAARGETLWWQICYVHFSSSNKLHCDTPAEYGEMILVLWQHLESTFGFLPDGLEIMLEPNTSNVTGSNLAGMIQAARDRLVNAGYTKPYIIAPSDSGRVGLSGPAATQSVIGDIKTANATAATYIDEYSYHRYNTAPTSTELQNLRTLAVSDGNKNTSMLEWTDAVVDDLHADLKHAKVSAWQQFSIGYPGLNVTGTGVLFGIGTSPTYPVVQFNRAKYFQSYFKYVRRGAVMKGASTDNSNFDGLPFVNSNGSYVVPIRCLTSGTVNVAGLPAGTYGIRYTTGAGDGTAPTAFDQTIANQTISSGQSVTFSMPAAGVVTVFDVNYLLNSVPDAPTSLSVSRNGNTGLNLSWTLGVGVAETSVTLERSINQSSWTTIPLPAGTTSYSDTGLTAGTTYYYRVKASNAAGDSLYSSISNKVFIILRYFGSVPNIS